MLAGLPACVFASAPPAKKAKPLPRVGEFFRFLDPLTEAPVVRLTSLTSNSFLPAPTNRFVSVKDRFLVFSSDRAGTVAPFQVDLRTGILTQLAQTRQLVCESLCLNQKRNALLLLDGGTLQEITLQNRKARTLADGVGSFSELPSGSGEADFVIVRNRQLQRLAAGSAPLAQDVETFCAARPGGQGSLFMRKTDENEREYWYAPLSSSGAAGPLVLARGKVSNAVWTPDGQALLFLREVVRANGIATSEIRSVSPESPVERCLAPTSQYAAFAPNADASVFVGASRSKAQPAILLLLASAEREMTLCEHRASHPAAVLPAFSPDSKRVYFQSDHEGKSALYSVNVELLVEPTTAGEAAQAFSHLPGNPLLRFLVC